MGKTQKTGNLVNIVVTDNDKNVTLPKALTIGEVPPIDDDSFKVPTTSWVKTKVDTKVDKVTGKGLSTNDFTDTLKTKLDGIEAGAEVNVNADWNSVSGDAQILNKPLIQPQLNGLGFVKANGTTISYDNSTYLTTISGITAGGELSGTYPNPTLVTSAVTGKLLTGVNITGGTVVATDSILTAFGKVQNQINGLVGGVNYQGTWNASTNFPALTSSVGTKGYYYVVTTAGTTSLNGITDWKLGDWVIFNGTTWDKVDNTDSVISVNGFTGAVSLTTDNISEGSANLYYTNARVRGAISLTTTGSSGAATYSSSTGVLNIPNYGSALSGYVTLDTTQTITGLKTFTSSGSANTIIVNHTSGSGHGIDITKGGSGEGLRINKTSGGGNAASITGGITLLSELNLTTKLADAYIASAATWNAKQNALNGTGFVKASGTTISYDNSSYYLASNPNGYTSNTGTVTSIATTAPLTGGTITTSGTLGITQATTSTSGYLSSTDWNTFNGKQNAITNPTTGTGTTNYVTKWTGASTLGNSLIYDNGTNVGIGTTSPSAPLQVLGTNSLTANTRYLKAHIGGASSWGLNSYEELAIGYSGIRSIYTGGITGGDGWDLAFSAGLSSAFSTGTQPERMRITSSGNVGIGTAAPYVKLDVRGGGIAQTTTDFVQSSAGSVIYMRTGATTGNTTYGVIQVGNTGDNIGGNLVLNQFGGNVGIGTTSPSEKLTVNGRILVSDLSLQGFYQSRTSDVAGGGVFGGNSFTLRNGATSEDLNFDVFNRNTLAWYTPMVIKNLGNVGIGTTSPAAKLDVNGNVRVTGTMTATLGGFNSDINDKKDLIYGAKSNVLDLNAASYLRKSTNSKEYGYIAQDVKKVLPEAVYETVSGLAVSYHMVNAAKIQALQEKIVSLEETIKLLSK